MTIFGLCLFCDDESLQRAIERIFSGVCNLHFCTTRTEAIAVLNHHPVACILADFYLKGKSTLPDIQHLRRLFRHIPLVVFSRHREPELIRKCGEIGVERYVHWDNRHQLLEIVLEIIERYRFKVEWEKNGISNGISIESCPLRVKQALKYMADCFLEIKTIEEISHRFDISRCLLEKQFRAACSITPKQLLLALKLHYATHLMENEGLKLKHVAYRLGYNDEHDFYRIFRKKIGMTAAKYRELYTSQDFLQIYYKRPKK